MTRCLLCLVIALFVVSCDDSKSPAKSPTAPSAALVAPDASALLSQAPARLAKSRVCSAYLRERSKLLVQLAKTPTDSALTRKAEHLAAMLTDACN
jgi:hypothetical protein